MEVEALGHSASFRMAGAQREVKTKLIDLNPNLNPIDHV